MRRRVEMTNVNYGNYYSRKMCVTRFPDMREIHLK